MNEHDHTEPVTPAVARPETPVAADAPPEPQALPVDPARAAAGRRGGERFHQLVRLGRRSEQEHHLTPGRQRLRQLVQRGRRYEQEHGLARKPRRPRRGDAWQEFLTALARVVKPAHRPAVKQLVAALQRPTTGAA